MLELQKIKKERMAEEARMVIYLDKFFTIYLEFLISYLLK